MQRCLRYARRCHDEVLARERQALLEVIRPADANAETSASVVTTMGTDIKSGHVRMTALLKMMQSFDNYDDLFLELMQVSPILALG